MSELAEMIRREMADRGVISFARFMELSLYCPRLGYYERHSKQIGCQGDFYTSPAIGSLLGELLATQFVCWLEEVDVARQSDNDRSVDRSRPFRLVEAGAHDGQLAHDILCWLRRFEPRWEQRLEYWILEPSRERQAWQQRTLSQFAPGVRWFESWSTLAAQPLCGIIFANELLDSFPVHRMVWDAHAGEWHEWGVGCAGDHFVWKPLPAAGKDFTPATAPTHWPKVPPEVLAILPHGFVMETSPGAEQWWEHGARALAQGKLMTLDYGLQEDELFNPARASGTLRAYVRHHGSADLLANPGDQDLTAHVNFSVLQRIGEDTGLVTEGLVTQEEFLMRVIHGENASRYLGTSERRRQFQTLTHPDHLGRFKVLVQSRD